MGAVVSQASDTEGAGALFQVTTLPLDQQLPLTSQGKTDYSADFFGFG